MSTLFVFEDFVEENQFHPHLKREMELEKEKAAEKKRRQELERKMCKVSLLIDIHYDVMVLTDASSLCIYIYAV